MHLQYQSGITHVTSSPDLGGRGLQNPNCSLAVDCHFGLYPVWAQMAWFQIR